MSENKKIYKSVYRPDFKIHQFVKLVGIRKGKKEDDLSRFVSPIFGNKVPDKVVIPKSPEGLGDSGKRLDAFRDKPKNSRDEYREFNIITNKSREEYLGGVIIEDEEEKTVEVIEPRKIIPIISNHEEKEEPVFKINEKPKNINLDPVLNENSEPKIDLHKREQPMVVRGNFEDEFVEEVKEIEKPKIVEKPKVQKVGNNKKYVKPPVTMFKKMTRDQESKPAWLLEQIEIINATLTDFGIEATVIGSTKGPTVTRYEISLQPGVNVNRISNISDNLMMNLKAKSLRIEAPIPGKPYVGLEVPNVNPEIVAFGNVVDDKEFLEAHDKPLQVALGVDIDGKNVYVDITKMPHGLIAGATNSGKSVCINTVLASLLIKNSPDELKLILIDPKMVELNAYNDLPHLITPVITDAKMAAQALKWAVDEMEKRYRIFANNRSRDIKSYNDNVKRGIVDEPGMPYIVVVIDELADLMMAAASDVEDAIQRITQKARAAGIHLIVATQRPTTDVVKGTIKSNIPARIAFKVASYVDSTTILDGAGAEGLLGKGDMLLKEVDRPHRLQGAYIPDDEIYKLTDYIRDMREADYILKHDDLKHRVEFKQVEKDDLFEPVAYYVVETRTASINRIMQEFSISFNRAQTIMKLLENYQIVSENLGTKAREVLVNLEELEEIIKNHE
ncbi:DNA translocase FtsK [Haploplasma axanthum]|uniref:Septum-associated FtsK-like translocase of DNA n=1 Tax=Haploplasma axanthum TaxID=29552 RepID=A0A449BD31_HAPAX|nr:DNA translocase FtsK [Haploplasma axanthum]VEU80364.1 Septum-associated FtsK-like translocase of DNA [Haploplasma axanthum]